MKATHRTGRFRAMCASRKCNHKSTLDAIFIDFIAVVAECNNYSYYFVCCNVLCCATMVCSRHWPIRVPCQSLEVQRCDARNERRSHLFHFDFIIRDHRHIYYRMQYTKYIVQYTYVCAQFQSIAYSYSRLPALRRAFTHHPRQ